MQGAASIVRISAVVVSLLYMVILLPHLGGIETQDFSSGWFLGGMAIAISWIPLLWFHRYCGHGSERLHIIVSFVPLILFGAFFSALFVVASTTH